jgi:hypothetical protein
VFGFGVWGLGLWVLGFGPNPQSPIPNPQSPIPINFNDSINYLINLFILFNQKINNFISIKNIKKFYFIDGN